MCLLFPVGYPFQETFTAVFTYNPFHSLIFEAMRLVISGILILAIWIMISVFKGEVKTWEGNSPIAVSGFTKTTDIFLKIFPEELHPWLRFHEQANIPFLRK